MGHSGRVRPVYVLYILLGSETSYINQFNIVFSKNMWTIKRFVRSQCTYGECSRNPCTSDYSRLCTKCTANFIHGVAARLVLWTSHPECSLDWSLRTWAKPYHSECTKCYGTNLEWFSREKFAGGGFFTKRTRSAIIGVIRHMRIISTYHAHWNLVWRVLDSSRHGLVLAVNGGGPYDIHGWTWTVGYYPAWWGQFAWYPSGPVRDG